MHLHNLVNLSKLSFPKSVGGKQEKENISFPRNVLFKNYEIELVSVFWNLVFLVNIIFTSFIIQFWK